MAATAETRALLEHLFVPTRALLRATKVTATRRPYVLGQKEDILLRRGMPGSSRERCSRRLGDKKDPTPAVAVVASALDLGRDRSVSEYGMGRVRQTRATIGEHQRSWAGKGTVLYVQQAKFRSGNGFTITRHWPQISLRLPVASSAPLRSAPLHRASPRCTVPPPLCLAHDARIGAPADAACGTQLKTDTGARRCLRLAPTSTPLRPPYTSARFRGASDASLVRRRDCRAADAMVCRVSGVGECECKRESEWECERECDRVDGGPPTSTTSTSSSSSSSSSF